MSWRDPNWRYTNAEETKKPNYLRERFKAIRKQQEKPKAEIRTLPQRVISKS
jgi:hypothetical protein